MKCPVMNINQRLGLFAILLGIFALFTKDPTKASMVRIDPNKLLLETHSTSRFIEPFDLAEKIISGTQYFILVDLRSKKEYEQGTIPFAINLSVKDLMAGALQRNQQIVLFSDDDTKSLNAWLALKSLDYKNVFILKGGYKGWVDNVLFPKIPAEVSQNEKEKYEKIKQVSLYFGGKPLLVSEGKTLEIQSPVTSSVNTQLSKPSVTSPKPAGQTKPKREGC